MEEALHPCQTCGACCTYFRVSFHRSETLEGSFQVPLELTSKESSEFLAMRHKNHNTPRCVALDGHVGKFVSCRVYNNRPSPCRNFKASYEDGIPNPRCDSCRIARGMNPLTPEDWDYKIRKIG